MKRLFLLALLMASVPMTYAQDGALVIPDFKELDHKAKETVNISLNGMLLHAAAGFIDDKDPDAAATKRILSGIHSIQVRSYQFDEDGAYSKEDVNAIRRQLNSPGWSSLVRTHDQKGQDVDVFIRIENDHPMGLAVVVSEPREFTVVNIVGSINLDDIPKIEKQLNLPKLGVTQQVPVAMSFPAQL
jgi:hypothetical protein